MGKKNKVDPEQAEEADELPKKEKFGKPVKYDPTFKGPIANRSCTDVICCILFLVCIGGLGITGYFGFTMGNPYTLIYPTDSRGQICGVSEAVADKPVLFFFDFLACASSQTLLEFKCNTPQICMSACPNQTYSPYKDLLIGAAVPSLLNFDDFICVYDFDPMYEHTSGGYTGLDGLFLMMEDDQCASYYLPSSPLADRCVPSFLVDSLSTVGDVFTSNDSYIVTANGENVTSGNAEELFSGAVSVFLELQSIFQVLYEDLVASWHMVLIGLCIGMLLSFIYIVIMRWLAGVIVWGSLIALFGGLGFGVYYCWIQYSALEGTAGADGKIEFSSNLLSYLRLQKTWMIFGIILLSVLCILLLITLCLCNRIRIAIALIKESSRAVGGMISTLFWPIFPFLMQLIVIGVWSLIAVYLATSHVATFTVVDAPTDFPLANGTACESTNFTDYYDLLNTTARCQFQSYEVHEYVIYMQFFNLFMFFWLMNFMIALGQVTLAGAFASYYWAFSKPGDIPAFPLLKSFWRAIRYHLGSIAFGSLIIAIIQIIRVLLEYVETKLKGKDNAVVKFLIKCLKCCFWCLEKFMKFLNKNAYILVAVYGKNFCTSAQQAFFLLMRNIVRVTVINKITDYLIFLGELSVTALVGVASFFFFTNQITFIGKYVDVPDLNYYWFPIILIALGTYAVAQTFFSVYDMAIDTLFLCFLEDLERHDGSAEKPYYMSKDLMDIVGKKNKKPEKQAID